MAHSRKDEARALDASELELVDKSHHPSVQDLTDAELADLIRLVRDRRDKATSTARRQRREMRGKTDPRGTRASADNSGTKLKGEVLSMAVRRLNGERERRSRMAARDQLVANARNALALRENSASGGGAPSGKKSRSAGKGMEANESTRRRKTVPGAKVGSVSQQNKRSQAKRDS